MFLDNLYNCIFSNIFGLPLVLLFLIPICILLSISFRYINVTMLLSSMRLSLTNEQDVSDKQQDHKKRPGISTITSFLIQLSNNIGVGNVAGAGFALYFGGPGVIFWLPITGVFISIIKFAEIVLGQKYRMVDENGQIHGGMFYAITKGLGRGNSAWLKSALFITACFVALVMAWTCIMSSGLQINQLCAIFNDRNQGKGTAIIVVLAMCILLLFVLLGEISRIANCAKLTPLMALLYICGCGAVMIRHSEDLLVALQIVYERAFHWKDMIASLVVSLQRLIFATGSGSMTSSIIHANSNTRYAAREGCCAFFECFLVAVILSIGAFTVLVSGVGCEGGSVAMQAAFQNSMGRFGSVILLLCTAVFCFNTVLSDGYIFQKALGYVFHHSKGYAYIYVIAIGLLSFYPSVAMLQLVDITTALAMVVSIVTILTLLGPIKQEVKLYLRSLRRAKG